MTQPHYLSTPEAETLDRLEAAKRYLAGSDTSISWGLPSLDKKIGSPRPGQFVVVGARSGNGKTTFLLNWMIRIHEGLIHPPVEQPGYEYKTCYLGTEMAPEELTILWSAIYLGYDPDAVLAKQWDRLPENAHKNLNTHLEILTMEYEKTWLPKHLSPTLDNVLDCIDTAVSWGARIIFVDHLQRLSSHASRSEREALKNATIALKTAATEQGILVVAASQFSRGENDVFAQYRPPHLGSFMGSSDIEGNADMALGLYRPLRPMNTKQERAIRNGDLPLDSFIRPNVMAAKCVKHRTRGSIVNTTVLLTAHQSRVDDYIDDWEEINEEDRHATERVSTTRSLRDLQEENELLANSKGEGSSRSATQDEDVSQLSIGV